MTASPWTLLAAAVPVLLAGEWLIGRVPWLWRFSIPAPVVGGLVVAAAVAGLRSAGAPVEVGKEVDAGWWLWIVRPGTAGRADVYLPLNIAFFTCVGLNASWSVVRGGGWRLVLLLLLATALAAVQNAVGIPLARAMNQHWAFGLVCGSVTLTGGPGTALGLRGDLVAAGLPNAGELGAAAATFGIVAGSLVGGPAAARLIRTRRLAGDREPRAPDRPDVGRSAGGGWLANVAALAGQRAGALLAVAILLACVKAGAWVSYGLRSADVRLPVYMGALLVGIAVRNLLDAARPGTLRTDVVDALASVLLGVFLTAAVMALDLAALASAAGPMLAILAVQVVLTVAFAYWVTFRLMGGDYEAAVATAGHVGFGLGITANAVANMEAVRARYGPAPRAFLVVTTVGAFLIDFTNAVVVSGFLNYFGRAGG